MKVKKLLQATSLAVSLALLVSTGGAESYRDYLDGGKQASLREVYTGRMDIGIPMEELEAADPAVSERIRQQCGLLICRDSTNGKEMLDRGASKKQKDPGHARVKTGKALDKLVSAAQQGMKIRAATLIQADNTPEWFFHEDWSSTGNAKDVDRETMICRMENAVKDQIRKLNEKAPDAIAEWEVVIAGKRDETDPYRTIIGDSYIEMAFRAAREAAEENQKLLWAFQEMPDENTVQRIRELREGGLLDGVSIVCSWDLAGTDWEAEEAVLRNLADTGTDIHLSDLEIGNTDRTAAGQMRLAARYKKIFALAEEIGVRSISLKALQDATGREKATPPRLISEKGRATPTFFGALQDVSVPLPGDENAIHEAVEQLDLENMIKKEADPVIVYKKASDHNPVMIQRFGADPWAMVYKDRVYLYMTGDEPVVKDGEKPKTNDYSNIVTLRVFSSDDLVNWIDHGSVRAAGSTGAAKWAQNSWAPCAAWKTIDGQDKFFLYFANSGGGIGVLTADNPAGPFTDPLGHALVSRSTPTCDSVTWLFDPAVLVDEDGSAYLYFGGGVPEGKQADPGTARVAKLSDDMIHLDGDPVQISPPYLFEDSGINRFGDTYVYSYCSNFNVPSAGSPQGFSSGEIVYMTSDNPMGPFTYAGQVLKNPGHFFGVGGNNHHCMFEFRGEWYITYHAATLDKAMGWNAGYRSVFIDKLELTDSGLPAPSKGTYQGVSQLKDMDPYAAIPGTTAVTMAGTTTVLADETDKKSGTGRMAVLSTTPDSWIAVSNVDFGEEGACSIRVVIRSEVPAKIEVLTDSETAEPVATFVIPACEADTEVTANLTSALKNVHNLYFRFTDSGITLLEWQFQ